jgi:hypothetical protein
MKTSEIAVTIGELITTEIEEVEKLEYITQTNEMTAIKIVMESGKRFYLRITDMPSP